MWATKKNAACARPSTSAGSSLGTALGRLQVMRESKEWRAAREMPKGEERTQRFRGIQQQAGLTQYGVERIALKHKNAGSLKVWIGAHECQMVAGAGVERG